MGNESFDLIFPYGSSSTYISSLRTVISNRESFLHYLRGSVEYLHNYGSTGKNVWLTPHQDYKC